MTPPKILLTSPIQPIGGCSPNVYSWDKSPTKVRIAMSFLNHPGLSFLKANLPCEILEYPDQKSFAAALQQKPDILGISFYINETDIAIRMAEEARAAGVKEIWAGNFGAFSPGTENTFDRVFSGWSEHQIAHILDLPPITFDNFVHPEMYGSFGSNLMPKMILSGILFTSRGCPWTCNFCQTPGFYGKSKPIPLETIDRVLWQYNRKGIRGINILDENFGTFKKHARQVIDLLHKYKMRWIALTRVDTLMRDFDYWQSKGLFGAHLGIESLNQDSLEDGSKRIDHSDSMKLLQRMSKNNMFVQAFYMLGFESDTVQSIQNDIRVLASLDIDVVQTQILTPYPKTEQCRIIEEKYGINDRNLSKYNSRNLVWNHPNISPDEMKKLQGWANEQLNSSKRALRTLSKLVLFHGKEQINLDGLKVLARSYFGQNKRLHRLYADQIQSAHEWTKIGWIPYEEYSSEESLSKELTTA